MLALPADAGHLRQRLFHHRRGVDKDLELARPAPGDPARQRSQPFLDRVVVVATAGIDRDLAPLGIARGGERIVIGAVIHAEHDYRARVGPQYLRVAPPRPGRRGPAPIALIDAPEEIPRNEAMNSFSDLLSRITASGT